MRVATWNLDAKATPATVAVLLAVDADILLLTEVPPGLVLPGYQLVWSAGLMEPGQHYAAVGCRGTEVRSLSGIHAASAAAVLRGTTFVSTVLPWTRATGQPWLGRTPTERMAAAVDELQRELRKADALVWGGDWNQPLEGSQAGFTLAGRDRLQRALTELGIKSHTRHLPSRTPGCSTIDHVASALHCRQADRIPVPAHLSDHDAYVVTLIDHPDACGGY